MNLLRDVPDAGHIINPLTVYLYMAVREICNKKSSGNVTTTGLTPSSSSDTPYHISTFCCKKYIKSKKYINKKLVIQEENAKCTHAFACTRTCIMPVIFNLCTILVCTCIEKKNTYNLQVLNIHL